MAYGIDISFAGRVMSVRVAGAVERGQVLRSSEMLNGIASACLENGCRGVLIDIRTASLEIHPDERREARATLAKVMGRGVGVAVLRTPDDLASDALLRGLAEIGGVPFKGFDDEAEALEWLSSPGWGEA